MNTSVEINKIKQTIAYMLMEDGIQSTVMYYPERVSARVTTPKGELYINVLIQIMEVNGIGEMAYKIKVTNKENNKVFYESVDNELMTLIDFIRCLHSFQE